MAIVTALVGGCTIKNAADHNVIPGIITGLTTGFAFWTMVANYKVREDQVINKKNKVRELKKQVGINEAR